MRKDTLIISGVALLVLIVVIGIFAFGREVAGNDASKEASKSQTVIMVPFSELARGIKSNIEKRVNYLITSDAELLELWKDMGAKGNAPTVDFTTSDVIAVFGAKESASGYTIDVSNVQDADKRLVQITITKPDATCAQTKTIMAPYELVIIPKTALPLTHEDVVTTTSCKR